MAVSAPPAAPAALPAPATSAGGRGRAPKRRGPRRTPGDRAIDVVIAAGLVLLTLATLYPFYYSVVVSLSTPAAVLQPGLHLWPQEFSLESYRIILSDSGIFGAYRNTIVRTVVATALALILTAMVAYPLAQPEFPHRRLLNFLLVFSMLFSGGFIAMYLLVRNLGMLDTLWALVLPGAVGAFNVIILRNFFQAIPRELIDSARIDGAGEMRILTRIVLPISKPALAVVALWVALANWNAWFDALLYISDPDKQFLQKYFARGILLGSVKG
ncbi:carbohydrate ABC transporter permease [Pseudactinotalea sp.]|uniref:carbohydrate ABC transporter permease n=1 Tax=Pseudactinotalea sp. TaxID=1926260 RepID=UPI003B3B3EF8